MPQMIVRLKVLWITSQRGSTTLTHINDIHHNDNQLNGLVCDTQHSNTTIKLSISLFIVMLSVVGPKRVCPWIRPNYIIVFGWSNCICESKEPLLKGRFSTVDLRVLTCLDQQLLMLQTLFTALQNKLTYTEVKCTEPSPSISVPSWIHLFIGAGSTPSLFCRRLSSIDRLLKTWWVFTTLLYF
jgi:hypothetical protein